MIGIKTIDIKEIPIKLIWIVALLSIIGLIALKSIAQHHPGNLYQNPFSKQLLFLIPAVLICIFILFIPRYTIHKYAYLFYVIGVIIVLLPFFDQSHVGTHRWLDIGLPFNLQPSEFAKVFTSLALARYLSDHNLQMKQFSSVIIPIVLVLIPTCVVLYQPDLGTAIILMAPVLPVLFWSGARPFHLFLLLAPIFSFITAFHNLAFTIYAILLGLIIILERPKIVLALSLFFGNIFLGLLSPALWNSLKLYQQNRILTLSKF